MFCVQEAAISKVSELERYHYSSLIIYMSKLLLHSSIVPVPPNEIMNRGKRQSRATNLRTTWANSTFVTLCWDHPDTGPPDVDYRVIHAAVQISGGSVTSVSYNFLLLNRLDTCTTFSGVNRGDLHIFHVNAVYLSSIFSAIHLEGKCAYWMRSHYRITPSR